MTETLAARRFAEADAQAEALIGWVRMAAAVVLAGSILLAAGSDARPDDPLLTRRLIFAIFGMGCYFLIGLAAVLIVRAGRYRPWMAWAAAFADVGLISWNLYGAAVSGGVSTFYALASPAAIMLPLVLTFGALRFRPGVQLSATLFAVAACAAIIFYQPPPGPMTADAARILDTSFSGPPNLIRIVMLLGVGLIVALAVWRARRLLERVIAEAEARANLTRFLPEGVSDDMSDEAVARLRAARRAMVGVMFVDIRDFTAMAERIGPEASAEMLTAYRAAALDAAREHGGIVDKFIGDGALLLFGLSGRDGAADAVGAAEALARRFADAPYRVGIGVHFGEAMVGAVGDDRRLEFTVIGDVVNIASRIEALTKAEGAVALASAEALGPQAGSARWRSIGLRAIRGRAAEIELFSLKSPSVPQ